MMTRFGFLATKTWGSWVGVGSARDLRDGHFNFLLKGGLYDLGGEVCFLSEKCREKPQDDLRGGGVGGRRCLEEFTSSMGGESLAARDLLRTSGSLLLESWVSASPKKDALMVGGLTVLFMHFVHLYRAQPCIAAEGEGRGVDHR